MSSSLVQTPQLDLTLVATHIQKRLFDRYYPRNPRHKLQIHNCRGTFGLVSPFHLYEHQQQEITNTLNSSPHRRPTTAPSLVPLISKFEALDAISLEFNVRDAQPAHLRLSRSKMRIGRKDTAADGGGGKNMRQKLLSRFERPGWSAATLRGFRGTSESSLGNKTGSSSDIEGSRGSRGLSTAATDKGKERASQRTINSEGSDRGKSFWARERRDGRNGKIRERIRFFDGMASPFSSKHPSIASAPKKPLYPIFERKQYIIPKTPTNSSPHIRNSKIQSSPWEGSHFVEAEQDLSSPLDRNASKSRRRNHESLERSISGQKPTIAANPSFKSQDRWWRSNSNGIGNLKAFYSARADWETRVNLEKENKRNHVYIPIREYERLKLAAQSRLHGESYRPGRRRLVGKRESSSVRDETRLRSTGIQDQVQLFNSDILEIERPPRPTTPFRHGSSQAPTSQSPTHAPPQIESSSNTSGFLDHTSLLPKTPPQPTFKEVSPNGATLAEVSQDHCSRSSGKRPRVDEQIQLFEAFGDSCQARIASIANSEGPKAIPATAKRIKTWPDPANRIRLLLPPINGDLYMDTILKDIALFGAFPEGVVMGKNRNERRDGEHPIQLQLRPHPRPFLRPAVSFSGPIWDEGMTKTEGVPQTLIQGIDSEDSMAIDLERSAAVDLEDPMAINSDDPEAIVIQPCDVPLDSVENMPVDDAVIEMERTASISPVRVSGVEVIDMCALSPTPAPNPPQPDKGGDGPVREICIQDGDGAGPDGKAVVVDIAVARCELVQPKPNRMTETWQIQRLCRFAGREDVKGWQDDQSWRRSKMVYVH